MHTIHLMISTKLVITFKWNFAYHTPHDFNKINDNFLMDFALIYFSETIYEFLFPQMPYAFWVCETVYEVKKKGKLLGVDMASFAGASTRVGLL